MNRAFLIIAAPAVVVSLAWLTVGWGLRVSLPAGIAMLLVASLTLLFRRRRQNLQAGR